MVLVLAAQVIASIVIFAGYAALTAGGDFFGSLDRIAGLQSPESLLVFLSTFIGPILVLWLLVPVLHKSRIGAAMMPVPGPLLRDFLIGAAIVWAIMAATVLLTLPFQSYTPNLSLPAWLGWLVPALMLIFIQVFGEELVFRGYLQPFLAARFASPLVWLAVPAVLFGALHWQPAQFGPNAWLVVVATTLMGFVFGTLTAHTGSIAAAVGVHFANNVTGVLFIATPGELSLLSLYLQPIDLTDVAATRISLLTNIALIGGAFAVYLWVTRNRPPRLQPIEGVFK
ncbi:MAG: type II CAAX endopeptidase family protein [Pseudomonadota bacterium]